jgi:exonuclease SbcC
MTFLSRLFKTKTIKAPSVEEQIKALESQTPEQLLTLAASTDNDVIRDAIIAKLPYNAGLLQLALGHTNSRTQLAARRRIGQLLDQQSISVKQLAADVPQQLDLIALASFSLKANLEVVESIQSPELLLQLACEGGTTQLRQAAAARIDTRAELEQLCKVAQSKDKAVYKLAKTKLDVFKAGDAKLIEAQNAIVQLCEKLEKLSRLDADALFKAKVELLEAEWNLLADKTSPELYARYQHVFTNKKLPSGQNKLHRKKSAIHKINRRATSCELLLMKHISSLKIFIRWMKLRLNNWLFANNNSAT